MSRGRLLAKKKKKAVSDLCEDHSAYDVKGNENAEDEDNSATDDDGNHVIENDLDAPFPLLLLSLSLALTLILVCLFVYILYDMVTVIVSSRVVFVFSIFIVFDVVGTVVFAKV